MKKTSLLLFLGLTVVTSLNSQPTDRVMDYALQSVKILEDGSYIEGAENIKTYKSENPFIVQSLKRIYGVAANDQYSYEINSITSSGRTYKEITIVETGKDQTRSFEFTARSEDTNVALLQKQIAQRRNEWIERCNANDASDLVTHLYSHAPIYFNHKKVIASRDALIKAYGYMNDEKYSLQLTPMHLEIVSNDLAFEIGQCSGSYRGKYVLVWKKDKKDRWRILIDSNI